MTKDISWSEILTSSEHKEYYYKEVTELDSEIGAFLQFDPEMGSALTALEHTTPLSNIPFAVKDNIAVKDFNLTCGSKMLEEFSSPYSATAVKRLLKAGAIPVGKVNLDEFGMGSATTNSALGKTVNPWDTKRVPGGSSGGSAAAVAAGMVPFALGSDTGGSVRQPANFCGVYGLKPTYGAVSRYGLVAYASSLECIGILSDSIDLMETVYDTIKGSDPKDQTSRDSLGDDPKLHADTMTIGVLENTEGLDVAVAQAYEEAIEQCKILGWKVLPVTIESLKYVVPVYYTIAAAEASANLARYTGVRYGHRCSQSTDVQSMTRETREEGFGAEVKSRIILGTYVLRSGFQDQYYVRAQKIRTRIKMDLAKVYEEVDLLMMPVFPTQAFPLTGDSLTPFQQKLADRYTITANLAGLPALSVPTGVKNGLPVGVQFMAHEFCEPHLFQAAKAYKGIYVPQKAQKNLQMIQEVS